MYKFKGKTKSFSEIVNDEHKWYTFKDGQLVPEARLDLVKKQGGELEEIKVVEKPEEVKKKVVKKTTKKVTKKKKK